MIIKGWVTPRYLDQKWFGNFSVSINTKKNGDIPVVISVNDNSYKGSFINNEIQGYGDLESEIYMLNQFIIENDMKEEYQKWRSSK